MSTNKVEISQLAEAVVKELKNYSEEVTEKIKKAESDIAKKTVTELKSTSPVGRTGKYAKGWKTTVTFENRYNKRVTIHNKVYQLTHLLEYGHAKVNGGRVEGKPHIAPAEEKAINEFLKTVKEAVK